MAEEDETTGLRDIYNTIRVGGGRGYRYPSFVGFGVETDKNAEPEGATNGGTGSSTPFYQPQLDPLFSGGDQDPFDDDELGTSNPTNPGAPATAQNAGIFDGPQYSPPEDSWRTAGNNYGAVPTTVSKVTSALSLGPGLLGGLGTAANVVGWGNDAFGARPDALKGTLADTSYSWGQLKRDVFGGFFGDGLPSSGDQARNIGEDRDKNPGFGPGKFGDTPASSTNPDAVGVGNFDTIDTSPLGDPGDNDPNKGTPASTDSVAGGRGRDPRDFDDRTSNDNNNSPSGNNESGGGDLGSDGRANFHEGGLTKGPNDQVQGEEFEALLLENEFVLPPDITAAIGPDVLEAVRTGQIPPQAIREALMPLLQQQSQQPQAPEPNQAQGLRGIQMQGGSYGVA